MVRLTDTQPCPATSPQSHGVAMVTAGHPNVLVLGLPAAHLGSPVVCAGAPAPNAVAKASTTVLVGGVGAAREGDATAHGGFLKASQATVLVGG